MSTKISGSHNKSGEGNTWFTGTEIGARKYAQDVIDSELHSLLSSGQVIIDQAYDLLEILEDQTGSGSVLTFTFSSAVELAWIRSVGGISRAGNAANIPTATKGIYCAADEPNPVTLRGTDLRVFAPIGTVISVWGYKP